MRKQSGYFVLCLGLFVGSFSSVLFRWITGNNFSCLEASISDSFSPSALHSPDDWLKKDPFDIIDLPDEDIGELGNQSFLMFVGVMTADNFLSSRAIAVYETWGRRLPGRIAFFTSENSTQPEKYRNLPVIRLKGVDDVYPPQLKAYEMLRFMWQNFGRYFQWFLRIDDDAYLRMDKITKLINSLDSTIPYYIGQPGIGNPDKRNDLGLHKNDNFCMGGPGIIFSQAMLGKLAPHIDKCIQEINTTEEDVELGLCVRRHLNYQCTWAHDLLQTFHNNRSVPPIIPYGDKLRTSELHYAYTLHPLKVPQNMYRVEMYYQGLSIQDLQHENMLLHRELLAMSQLFSNHHKDKVVTADSVWLGKPPGLRKYIPQDENDVLKWDFLTEKAIVSDLYYNPQQKTMSAIAAGLHDARLLFNETQFRLEGKGLRSTKYFYNYYRVDPLHGVDYLLYMEAVNKQIKFKDRKRNFFLQRQFTELEIRETLDGRDVSDKDEDDDKDGSSLLSFSQKKKNKIEQFEDKNVVFILPLSGRITTFQRFIGVYEKVCLQKNEKTKLIAVVYQINGDDSYQQTVAILKDLQMKYPTRDIVIVTREDDFSRGIALQAGAQAVRGNDLLFFVDVDMIFEEDTLFRIRANTIFGQSAYFPIVFSEFDPGIVYNATVSPSHSVITQDNGYWIQFGFGICSCYKEDLTTVGGYNVDIRGWGGEDVDIFNKFIAAGENITIFRAVDPGLIHIYHKRHCAANLPKDQMVMCQGTRADTYVSVYNAANLIYKDKEKMLSIARELNKLPEPNHGYK